MSGNNRTLDELQRDLESLYLLRKSRNKHVGDLLLQKKKLEEQIEVAKKIDEKKINDLTFSLSDYLSNNSFEEELPDTGSPEIKIQISPPGPPLEELVLHPFDPTPAESNQGPLFLLEEFSEQFKGVYFPYSVLKTLLPKTDVKTMSFYRGEYAYFIRSSDKQNSTYFVFWTVRISTFGELLWKFDGMITCPEQYSNHLGNYIHDEVRRKRNENPPEQQ